MAPCLGTKRDGGPCTASVELPQTHCWWHDDKNAAQRRRAASRGGKSRPSRVTKDLHLLLERLTERVLAGDIPPYPGSVAGQLIGVRLRLLEYERRVRETDTLELRVEELATALERQQQKGGGGYSFTA